MIYVFYVLMGVSAIVAIPSLIGVVQGMFTEPTNQNPDVSLVEFLLSATVFCLAAICVQLWDGFPG